MKTILAAIDFSPVSRRVMAEAIKLAQGVRGRLVVLFAVKPPEIVTDLAPWVGEALQFTAEVERSGREHLRRWQKRLKARGTTVETVCELGYPATTILAQAKRLDASYIVLGSHGHTAFYDLVAGSTTSGVLKRASCPVVVVPAVPKKPKKRRK